MDSEIVSSLKKRYANVPPFVLSRSIERANTAGELFDILDTIPSELPICWDSKKRRWVPTSLPSEPPRSKPQRSKK